MIVLLLFGREEKSLLTVSLSLCLIRGFSTFDDTIFAAGEEDAKIKDKKNIVKNQERVREEEKTGKQVCSSIHKIWEDESFSLTLK